VDSRERSIIEFLRRCVEAETVSEQTLKRDSRTVIVLSEGPNPLIVEGAVDLPPTQHARDWVAGMRLAAKPEPLYIGYPLVREMGTRHSFAPLMIAEAKLVGDSRVTVRDPTVELSTVAMRLLGIPPQEHEAFLAMAADVEPGEPAAGATLEVLRATKLPVPETPAVLGSPHGVEITNEAAVFVGDPGQAIITQALRRELQQLLRLDLSPESPLTALLNPTIDTGLVTPEPLPNAVTANYEQELATATALQNRLTVVTGPPGTGKTQVLVNTVAACLARGQTVLLASKNNHAIDGVVARLQQSSAAALPVRVGNRDQVPVALDAVSTALARCEPRSGL
jgi:hypothetical protein